MVRVLSVDLACTRYSDLGIIGVQCGRSGFKVQPFGPADVGLRGDPAPGDLAQALTEHCKRLAVSVLLLDGPQGWKNPENGLSHSRVCERILNTPGKTGLPGLVKPAAYLRFISFSIAVFQALVTSGFRLFSQDMEGQVVMESFPFSAWRHLGLVPLPGKSRARPTDLRRATYDLRRIFSVGIPDGLSHDELQALVVAFAGVAVAAGTKRGYVVAGVAPSVISGTVREGFIVNPTREALARRDG